MTVSDIKASLYNALAVEADVELASVGFARSAKGTEFTRKLPDAIQTFDISLAVRPAYSRDAIAHVYPRVRLSMPEVCRIAEELVAGNPVLLANAPHVMVNRALEHLVPKSERQQWYAFQKEDFPQIAREVADTCMKWGLPFFDDYRTAGDVVRGYEAGDDRPRLQENWAIFVAATYLHLGLNGKAVEVINGAFSTLGAQRKFAAVFSNLERLTRGDNPDLPKSQSPSS